MFKMVHKYVLNIVENEVFHNKNEYKIQITLCTF